MKQMTIRSVTLSALLVFVCNSTFLACGGNGKSSPPPQKTEEPKKNPEPSQQPPEAENPPPPETQTPPQEESRIPPTEPVPSPNIPSPVPPPTNPAPAPAPAPRTEVPPPPPAAPPTQPVPPAAPLPQTHLAVLFNQYLDSPSSGDLKEIEQKTEPIITEVFNDDDQIRAKIWEIQNIIKDRYDHNKYNSAQSEKVQILESGIAVASNDRDLSTIGKDAALMAGSALGLALLRGYSADAAMGSVARRAYERMKAEASKLKDGGSEVVANLFKTQTYRDWLENSKLWFRENLKRLSAEEKVVRYLENFGLNPSDGEFLKRTLTKVEPSSFYRIRDLQFHGESSRLKVAAGKAPHPTAEKYGYLAFQLKSGPFFNKQTEYYVTDEIDEARLREMASRLSARLNGEVNSTGARLKRLPREGFTLPSFNTPAAVRTFAYSGGLLTAGYALSLSRDFDFSNLYLEALLDDSKQKNNVPLSTEIPNYETFRAALEH